MYLLFAFCICKALLLRRGLYSFVSFTDAERVKSENGSSNFSRPFLFWEGKQDGKTICYLLFLFLFSWQADLSVRWGADAKGNVMRSADPANNSQELQPQRLC